MEIKVKQSKLLFAGDSFKVVIFSVISGYNKKSFKAKGNIPKLSTHDVIEVDGEFIQSEKGEQFHVRSWRRPVPGTKDEIISFLASSLFNGIGPKKAKIIVDHLDDLIIRDFTSISLNDLIDIKGIKKEQAETIIEKIQENFALYGLIEMYKPYGILTDILIKAHAIMGNDVKMLENNPYLLTQNRLIDFDTADHIGLKMGIMPHSSERLDTVIEIILKETVINQGHCYMEEEMFFKKCLYLLNRYISKPEDMVHESSLIAHVESSKLVINDKGKVYPPHLFFAEKTIAKKLNLLMQSSSKVNPLTLDIAIQIFEEDNGITLSEEQREVFYQLFTNNVLVLTGGPGTGKTFAINGILQVYKKLFPHQQVALAAPTGRAAKKLGEVTGMGSHALTIHRLLGLGVISHNKPLFDEKLALPHTLFIIDEFSMVDTELAAMTLKAIENGSKVLIVGDSDQLPSVKPGNVLSDLLSAGIPHVRLTKIFRQAEGSTVIKNAHRINQGTAYDFNNYKDSFFIEEDNSERVAAYVEAAVNRLLIKGENINDIMVLSPMKKGYAGVDYINEKIRSLVNPTSPSKNEITYMNQLYREGDKVMFTVNDKNLELSNGDIGYIDSINIEEKIIMLKIEGRKVTLNQNHWKALNHAYATTIHKSQGNQSKIVITILSDEHDLMLTRNLFLTAITRTEETFILVASKNATLRAIENNRTRNRNSYLTQRIKDIRKYISVKKAN